MIYRVGNGYAKVQHNGTDIFADTERHRVW